jgi:hypothetical protein
MKITPISWANDCMAIASPEEEPPVHMMAPSFSIIRLSFKQVPKPDIDASVETRPIGGLGVHLVRSLMDDASASYDGTGNLITLRKMLAH